jgi:hypothetical protein
MAALCLGSLEALAGPNNQLVVLTHLVRIPLTIYRSQIAFGSDLASQPGAYQFLSRLEQVEPLCAAAGLGRAPSGGGRQTSFRVHVSFSGVA